MKLQHRELCATWSRFKHNIPSTQIHWKEASHLLTPPLSGHVGLHLHQEDISSLDLTILKPACAARPDVFQMPATKPYITNCELLWQPKSVNTSTNYPHVQFLSSRSNLLAASIQFDRVVDSQTRPPLLYTPLTTAISIKIKRRHSRTREVCLTSCDRNRSIKASSSTVFAVATVVLHVCQTASHVVTKPSTGSRSSARALSGVSHVLLLGASLPLKAL